MPAPGVLGVESDAFSPLEFWVAGGADGVSSFGGGVSSLTEAGSTIARKSLGGTFSTMI